MIRLLFLLLVSLLGTAWSSDFPAGSPAFKVNYAEALKTAAAENKPLVVIFSAGYCPPCVRMKKEVYPSAEVKPFHDRFVWVYVDVSEEGNAELARKFDVQPIPHLQFVTKEGKPFSNWIGGANSTNLAQILALVLKETGK